MTTEDYYFSKLLKLLQGTYVTYTLLYPTSTVDHYSVGQRSQSDHRPIPIYDPLSVNKVPIDPPYIGPPVSNTCGDGPDTEALAVYHQKDIKRYGSVVR